MGRHVAEKKFIIQFSYIKHTPNYWAEKSGKILRLYMNNYDVSVPYPRLKCHSSTLLQRINV